MRYDPGLLDEIRNRVSISAIVGRAVQWDRRKSRPAKGDYWACCPFHGEKSASFHVEDRKGRYHCFGCKASGDIFTFLVERDGATFPEAVERLAAEAGVAIPEPSPDDRQKAAIRATLHDVVSIAAAWFQEQLKAVVGDTARQYLASRGINGTVIREFGIGYAPASKTALISYLSARNVSVEQMIEAGLVVAPEGSDSRYDRFRDRVMFPISDSRGRVIAFGGRALDKSAPAKYLNSPETPIFRKGGALYNYDRARAEAHRRSRLFVVEGYVDVIAMWRAGAPNTVAPLGTALTEDQISLLWRNCPEPTLCFDGDSAGIKAAHRALDLALPLLSPGHSLEFVFLPDGLDPDDLLRRSGPAALMAALENRTSMIDVLWERALAANDRSTPERRALLETYVFTAVGSIADHVVRSHYRNAMRERLNSLFAPAALKRRSENSTDWAGGEGGGVLLGALAAIERRAEASNSLREEGCYDVDL